MKVFIDFKAKLLLLLDLISAGSLFRHDNKWHKPKHLEIPVNHLSDDSFVLRSSEFSKSIPQRSSFALSSPGQRVGEAKQGITISVLKAISFSRVDRCEKCLSFSNSCVRWYLAGADRQVKAGGRADSSRARVRRVTATHQWRIPLRAAVDTTGQSLAAAYNTCSVTGHTHAHGRRKCRHARLFLDSD